MHPNCVECRRLWAEYAKATRSHLALDSKLHIEALNREHEDIAALTRCVEYAERVRALAREAIRQHDAAWDAAATRSAGAPLLDSDDHEARLMTIFTDCANRLRTGYVELYRPTRSMLLPEYTNLLKNLESLRVSHVRAIAELKEYRNSKTTMSLPRSKSASA